MASPVGNEHGGVSNAIATAANALKNKFSNIWPLLKSKLNELARSSSCIPPSWYTSKFIPTEVALCLLICSMFPENFRIPVEDLVMYGMGLELFEDMHDMIEARHRVHAVIKIFNDLKYPRKQIGDQIRIAHEEFRPHNDYVKVLAGAHDLANSVASSCPFLFHREIVTKKWPESNLTRYKDCFGLALVLKKINHLMYFKCPKLSFLQLQYGDDSQVIPADFFKGMENLRVLSLDIPSLPYSLDVLRNLRTLHVKLLEFKDMHWIGGLKNLEFLSISTISLTNIPREMGHLEKLRVLNLRKVSLAYIPPGVLSRMLKLEELYLPLSFIRWACRAEEHKEYDEWNSAEEDNFDDGEIINASLSEIVFLPLNALQVTVSNASVLPRKSPIFKNIQLFKILEPNSIKHQHFSENSMNELQLTGDAHDVKESGICDLMCITEKLILTRVTNLKNVIYQLEDCDLPLLKKLLISECDELEYVIDTTPKPILPKYYSFCKLTKDLHLSMLPNLKGIWCGNWTNFRCFENLSHISIRFCHKLKYGFPLSIVRGWTLLKSVEVLDCNEMVAIFYEDEEDGIPLMLGSIEKLDLHSLPNLIGILINKDNTITVHDATNQSLTTNKIVSDDLDCMEGSSSTFDGNFKSFPSDESTSRLYKDSIDDDEVIVPSSNSKSKGKLQQGITQQLLIHKQVSLDNNNCRLEAYCAFPTRLAEIWFRNLKRLKIAFCDTIKVIFLFKENHATAKAFNSLEELELYGLRNLEHIWLQIPSRMIAFQNLQLLVLSKCQNAYLFSPQVARLLVKLQKVCISRCKKMELIIVRENEDNVEEKIVFNRLKVLELQHMPNLRMFCSGIYEIQLPLLDSLKFDQCNKMIYFSYGLLKTPVLKRIEVNGSLLSLKEDLNATIKREAIRNYKLFTFADIKNAANNFGAKYLVGETGFGRIYKGWIDEKTFRPSKTGIGMPVAIRKLNLTSDQYVGEFQSELYLERLWHPNLVKLLGHCLENETLLLVYEFVQLGSLDKHLFKRYGVDANLSWDMRLKIATGVAQGLHLLHTLEPKLIHGHIKPSNILLDWNCNAKISDFRMARLPSDGDPYTTTNGMGTFGYAAPELGATGYLHIKSDVYSFGVVLLELITGLKVIDTKRPEGQQNLVDWSKPCLSQKKRLRNIVDVRIEGQYSWKSMLLVAQLSLKCLESEPKSRPSMGVVVDALQQMYADNTKQAGR